MIRLIISIALLIAGLFCFIPERAVSGKSGHGPLADGSANAPGGSANAPGVFTNSGAGAAGTNYLGTGGVRPPWKVAGVDYRTGYDTTIGALNDPISGGFPGCATPNNGTHILSITSAPCTIQQYDFSLENGWQIQIANTCTSGTVILKNNNFLQGTNFGTASALGMIIAMTGSTCDLDLEQNVIDGNSCVYTSSTSIAGLVSVSTGTKNVTARYNQLLNSPQHGIGLGSNLTGSTFTSQYNYYRNSFGQYNTNNNHANPYLLSATGVVTVLQQFDTIIGAGTGGDFSIVGACPANQSFVRGGGGTSAYAYIDPNTFPPLDAVAYAQIDHNTFITEPANGGGPWVTFIVRVNSASNAQGPVYNNLIYANYIDPSNTDFGVYSSSFLTFPPLNAKNNIALVNGGACNSNGSGVSCGP